MAEPELTILPGLFQTETYETFKNNLEKSKVFDSPFTVKEIFGDRPQTGARMVELKYLHDIKTNPNKYEPETVDQATEFIQGYTSPDYGAGSVGVAAEFSQHKEFLERYGKDTEAQARASGPPPPRQYKRRPAATEEGFIETPIRDPRLDNVEDLQELESFGIYQGDQYYDAPEGFSDAVEKYTGQSPIDYVKDLGKSLISVSIPEGLPDITYESPWRVKKMFYPVDLTTGEAKSLVKNEDPNAIFRYIDPRDPSRGLAVKSEKTNNVFVPFRPEFGGTMVADAVYTGLTEELTPILLETAGLILTRGLKGTGFKESLKRGTKEIGMATGAAVLGRYAQLLYGQQMGINPDLDPWRALEDAGVAGLWATGGVLAANTLLGIINGISQAITGKFLPPSVLDKLFKAVDRIKTPKLKPEFSREELNDAVKEAGDEVGETLGNYQQTTGEILQDDYFLGVEKELYGYLNDTSKGRAAFDLLIENQEGSLRTFWNSLTRPNPDLPEGVSFASFKDYIEESREQSLKLAEEAAQRARKDLETDASFVSRIATDPEETATELAAPIISKVEVRKDSLFPRDTPEITYARNERYQTAKKEYETALNNYSNVRYPKASVKNVQFIKEPFKRLLEGKQDSGQILRSLEDAEAAQIARDIAPMAADGVSTIQQLLGLQFVKDANGDDIIAPKANWSLKDYAVAREVAHSLSVSHSNASVREATAALVDGFDLQIEDLLREGAKQRIREEVPALADIKGISNNVVEEWILKNKWGDDITETFTSLREVGGALDSAWLTELTKKRPEEIAEYVLSANSNTVEALMKELLVQPDSATKIRGIRQLILGEIDKKVGKGTVAEQTKNWKDFKNNYEMNLAAVFDEDTFIKLTNWEKAQAKAVAGMDEIDESILQLEKEYEGGISNVIGSFIEGGAAKKRSGEFADLDDFKELIKKYPALKPYTAELFKKQLRSKFEDQSIEQGRGVLDGGLLVKAVNDFISGPVAAGQTGTKDLGLMFSKLLGPEIGRKYAKDLRKFNVLLQQSVNRGMKGPMSSTPGGGNRIEDQLTKTQTLRTIMRAIIAPLSSLGRKLNLGAERIGVKSLDNLLEILVDPSKLEQLVRAEKNKLTAANWIKFMGALAASRQIDIGSDLNRTEREKLVDDMIEGYDIRKDYFYSKYPSIQMILEGR
tara:strand:+ start:2043 stop:5561 length:3519 start_codon:yes stop_codon:yes gene_type:complete